MGPAWLRDGPGLSRLRRWAPGRAERAMKTSTRLAACPPNRVVTAALQDGIFGKRGGERQELLINLLGTGRR